MDLRSPLEVAIERVIEALEADASLEDARESLRRALTLYAQTVADEAVDKLRRRL